MTPAAITQYLQQFCQQQTDRAQAIDPAYAKLWQEIESQLMAGGKRLRPLLTVLGYQAAGGTDLPAILPIAASQEMLHLGLLIHDDIIDRDYYRRGQLNIEGHYRQIYSSDNLARGTAVLAGDLAITAAFQLIQNSSVKAELKLQATSLLSQSLFEVIGGELLEVESTVRPATLDGCLKIARYKTASYSFVGPLITGAQMAGGDQDLRDGLTEYGNALGIAFQLADDIASIFTPKAQTGKTELSDLREGKPTYLLLSARAKLSPGEWQRLTELGDSKLTAAVIKEVQELIRDSGALEQTHTVMNDYGDQARTTLNGLSIDDDTKASLNHIIDKYLTQA